MTTAKSPARALVSEVCNNHRNSDLRADSEPILSAIDERIAAERERSRILLAHLKTAIRFANEALSAWSKQEELRVGESLLALSGRQKGFRPEIDSIHQAIKQAEELLK